jgi:hypothetical protein
MHHMGIDLDILRPDMQIDSVFPGMVHLLQCISDSVDRSILAPVGDSIPHIRTAPFLLPPHRLPIMPVHLDDFSLPPE